MKPKNILTFAALSALAAVSAQAAVLNIADYTLVPDGTDFGSANSNLPAAQEGVLTNIQLLNGNNTIVKSTDPVAYYVSTLTFGNDTSADIYLHFSASIGQDRFGIKATSSTGLITIWGANATVQSFDFGSSLAGQTLTIIGKFEYNDGTAELYGSANASDDTIATFWINPTVADTEGAGMPDGYSITGPGVANPNFTGDVVGRPWNSSGFVMLEQRIENNNTPGTSGATSILNTTVLTGTDATFANALALAVIPEPSSALLGAFGALALLRRRR